MGLAVLLFSGDADCVGQEGWRIVDREREIVAGAGGMWMWMGDWWEASIAGFCSDEGPAGGGTGAQVLLGRGLGMAFHVAR